ncbi:MAG: hypothetical protein Q9207_006176 [Kuettlingeria erythrocarpa]
MSFSLLPATGSSKSNAIIIDDEEDVQMDTPPQLKEARAEAPNASLCVTSNPKPEKWMTTPATMVIGAPPLITLGEGRYQTTFNSLVVQKNRADFFKRSYPQLRAGNVVVNQYYGEQAKHFPLIRENTIVETANGTRLLAFVKGGMATGVSSEDYAALRKQSEDAAAELIRVDPNDSTRDSRLVAREEKRARLALQGLKLIRKHFSYIKPIGGYYGPSMIHTDARKTPEVTGAYMKDTAWEHVQVSRLVSMVDTEGFHQEALAKYQGLGKENLEYLYQGPEAIHLGLDFLVNVASGPHRDDHDVPTAWTTTNTWGSYAGGHLVLPELGIRVEQQPGDVIMMHARVMIHHILEPYGGNRICNVRYSNRFVLRPLPPRPDLRLACPFEGCTEVRESKPSFMKHLKGPAGLARREKARKANTGSYHFVDTQEANLIYEQAVEASLARGRVAKGAGIGDGENNDVEMGEATPM